MTRGRPRETSRQLAHPFSQQDGTIQPEIKLTGILNTYAMNPDEDTHGWGTQVFPGE
jgi:Cu2+-containing amine oxidase